MWNITVMNMHYVDLLCLISVQT